jgi:hypothetical protein
MKGQKVAGQAVKTARRRWPISAVDVRHRLATLRWAVPVTLILLVVVYELVPASWVFEHYGFRSHLLLEVLVFGTVGPALAFVLLDYFGRYLDERDTSELQAKILKRAREDAQTSRKLNDDAVQVMFAAGNLIESLKAHQKELPGETAAHTAAIQKALDKTMRDIRSHLEKRH